MEPDPEVIDGKCDIYWSTYPTDKCFQNTAMIMSIWLLNHELFISVLVGYLAVRVVS